MVTTDPANASPRLYGEPHEVAPDVFMHPAFVNTYAVRTPVGLLLIDPGLGNLADSVHAAVRVWSDAALHTAVYTHGHADHAFGLRPFLAAGERPQIIAQENCPQRFHRYHLTHGWNARINQRQFSLAQPLFPDRFDWPTLTFRQLFVGDLIIWQAPNCGNPQKVQRYPLEWANALEEMAGLDAEWLFPGHGIAVQGTAAVRMVLTETARYLRIIIDQVLERMNAGQTPEEIFHAVEPDAELAKRPFLQARYDHPKFIVRNLLRLWGGWWNGNAADLLPATWAAQAAEIAGLAGGVAKLIERGRALLADGHAVMAAHLAEWATRAAPGDHAAQTLKRDVYARCLSEAESLMAQGIYRAAMNDARQALGEPPETGSGLGMGLEHSR
jgi:alkyl sulfatase BDS1-like metallo-beta-lactamase superfamily hydrolase